jgi:hypothetical protein
VGVGGPGARRLTIRSRGRSKEAGALHGTFWLAPLNSNVSQQKEGTAVKIKMLLISSAILLSACAPKSELEAANNQIAELKNTIAQLQAENSQLKAQVEKKPELPVNLSLRKAMMGPGFVAVFNTTVKSPVSVLATVNSAALGTSKKF